MGVVLMSQYLCGTSFKCCNDSFSTGWPPRGAGGLQKVTLSLILGGGAGWL